MAWVNPEAINAAPIVDNATLLFAASLNFCQLVKDPWLVARSGKTNDFCCSNLKRTMLL